jgi:hypothetical protein
VFLCKGYTLGLMVYSAAQIKCKCKDNIKIDVKEIRCEGANWINLAQGRVQWRSPVNTVMGFRVP